MICFDCKKEIETGEDKLMLGLDKPYINLWFHKHCYKLNVEPDIDVYMGKYALDMVQLKENENKQGKNR